MSASLSLVHFQPLPRDCLLVFPPLCPPNFSSCVARTDAMNAPRGRLDRQNSPTLTVPSQHALHQQPKDRNATTPIQPPRLEPPQSQRRHHVMSFQKLWLCRYAYTYGHAGTQYRSKNAGTHNCGYAGMQYRSKNCGYAIMQYRSKNCGYATPKTVFRPQKKTQTSIDIDLTFYFQEKREEIRRPCA